MLKLKPKNPAMWRITSSNCELVTGSRIVVSNLGRLAFNGGCWYERMVGLSIRSYLN